MKWIGTQTIYDNLRLSGNANNILIGDGTGTLALKAGDLDMYNAVDDGDPTISLGSSATNRLLIKADYHSGAQTLEKIFFETYTAGSSTDDGSINFKVDETGICQVKDHGININANKGLTIGGNNILTDSSGTTTLNNIDALDATTIATFETAMEANLDTFGSQMTSASALATVGTITTGVWNGTAVASAYLDSDTAHLSGAQTVTGVKTIGTNVKLQFRDANSYINSPDSNDIEIAATDITLDAAGTIKLEGPVRSTGQIQSTYHGFTIDMDTTKQYIGLLDADSENTSTTNGDLPLVAPVAGKLLQVSLRANKDLSGVTLTWRLETQATGVTFGTGPTIVGTQSGAGCTTSSITTYDFQSSLDSGDNIIDAGDTVYLSIQSGGATTNTKYYITCLWEWDFSSIG